MMTLTKQENILFYSAVIFIYVLAWVLQDSLFLNWDVGWSLHMASLASEGKSYVTDYFDPNPPIVLFLYMLPVLFSKWLSVNIVIPFRIYSFSLVAISFFCANYFIRRIISKEDNFFGCLFLIATTVLNLIVPMYWFGERDCLLMIFIMPYLLLLTYQLQGGTVKKSYAVLLGLFAGIGFVIKPHFFPIFFAVEIFFMCYKKNWLAWYRAEVLTVCIFFVTYAAVTLLFFPEYVYVVAPYLVKTYYSNLGGPFIKVILFPPVLFCALAIIFYFIQYKDNSYKILSTLLAISLAGILMAYFMQRSPSHYHILPALTVAVLLSLELFYQALTISRENFLRLILMASLFYVFLNSYSGHLWQLLFFKDYISIGFYTILVTLLLYLTWENKNFLSVACAVVVIIYGSILSTYLTEGIYWCPYHMTRTSLIIAALYGICVSKKIMHLSNHILVGFTAIIIFAYPVSYTEHLYKEALTYKTSVLQNLLTFMHDQRPRQSLYVMSDRDYYEEPLADYIDVDLTQRYAALWMIDDLAKRRHTSVESMRRYIQNNKESNFFINLIAEDFFKHKPSLVFVDNREFNINDTREHLDLLNVFQNNKMFLREWSHYAYLTTLSAGPTEENFGDYNLDVYKRID